MHDQAIRDALDEYAERHLPHSANPWPMIADRATMRPRKATIRRAIMIPTLLLIVVFASAGALGLSRWQRFTTREVPRETLANAGLLHTIGQTRSTDNYTVTLHRAYADSNIIILETSVRDQHGIDMTNLRPRWQLTDAQGNAIPQEFDSGTTEVAPGVLGQYATFDAAALPMTSPMLVLRLRLTLEQIGVLPTSSAVAGGPLATPNAARGSNGSRALATSGLPAAYNPIAAPFVFDFAVPFVRGVVVTPQQTVNAAGIPLILRRVVVTPAETRATICYTPTAGHPNGERWLIIADDNGRRIPAVPDAAAVPPERCGVLHLQGAPTRAGKHELRITELAWGPTASETRLHGPWRFHFALP